MVGLHKINVLVCFAASLNTRQAYDLRHSVHKSFYSIAGRAARATFDVPQTKFPEISRPFAALVSGVYFFRAHVNGSERSRVLK